MSQGTKPTGAPDKWPLRRQLRATFLAAGGRRRGCMARTAPELVHAARTA